MHVYLHVITPEAYRTPRQWVLSRLYCRLVNDLLESQVYYAQLAATSFSLSCTETGLMLQLQVGWQLPAIEMLQFFVKQPCCLAVSEEPAALLHNSPCHPCNMCSVASLPQGYSSVVPRLLEVVLQGMTGGMLDKEHVQRRWDLPHTPHAPSLPPLLGACKRP